MNKHYVFVYGSLKKNFCNHSVINDSSTELIKFFATTVRSDFGMVSFGGFPGVYQTDNSEISKHVSGQVFCVSDKTLDRLDMLESNGRFYIRELVSIKGMIEPCWMYVLAPARVRRTDFENESRKAPRIMMVNNDSSYFWSKSCEW